MGNCIYMSSSEIGTASLNSWNHSVHNARAWLLEQIWQPFTVLHSWFDI